MNPLIIALDVDSADEAWRLVEQVGDAAGFFKVGMELYAAAGLAFVRRLREAGKSVFLDLKLYDIGETVKRATSVLCRAVEPELLTVHGSQAVMRAAADGRGASKTKLLAVTVLTSFDQEDLRDLGYDVPVSQLVELRVRKARGAEMDGIVCSPLEVCRVRELGGPEMKLVTPGIRSAGAATGDQKRVATPAEAIANGADYLVIGREVTRASDPKAACLRILDQLPL